MAEIHSAAVTEGKRLTGGFIQYWGALDQATWQVVLDSMRRAGMKTVIIQYLETPDNPFIMPGSNEADNTRIILDYADKTPDMEVFIGLRYNPRFFETKNWENDDFAKSLNAPGGEADLNINLADEAWESYSNGPDGKPRRSLSGWYIPNEMWNQSYTSVQLRELRKFHRAISDYCKSKDKTKLVAVSPFFNPVDPGFLGPSEYAKMFGDFLKSADGQEAGVDVVMLQDGVGARNLVVDESQAKKFHTYTIDGKVRPYYEQFATMSKSKGVKFWGNVESFESVPCNWPTEIRRLSEQINVTSPFVEKLVTFDFFHYMNPSAHLHERNLYYVMAEKNLYWCYLRKFMPEAVKTGDPTCPF